MNHLKSLFTAILPALFIAGVVAASTTISQNIVTDGDLTVGGSAGIGTTDPVGQLEVKHASATLSDPHIAIEGSGGSTDDFAIWAQSGMNKLNIGYENDTNTGTFITFDASTGGSFSGNVGIGTDSPGSKLDVAGDVNATGSYLGDGSQLSGVLKSTGENLVSYWKFEDSLLDAGLTQDLSLGAGTETYVNSPFGRALDFDGSTYYTANDADYDFEHTDSFSISFWIKKDTTIPSTSEVHLAKQNGFAGGDRGFLFWTWNGSSGNILFRLDQGTDTEIAGSVLNGGQWYHVVGTYDGSSNRSGMKIYVNGVLDVTGTSQAITSSILNNESLAMGAFSNGLNKSNMQLDDVKIWNTELTAEQVETLFHMR